MTRCTTDACSNQCLEEASPTAQGQVRALASCLQRTSCTQETCNQVCAAEVSACFGPAQSGPPSTPASNSPTGTPNGGTVNCMGMVDCLQSCGDQACADQCLSQGDQDSVQKVRDLYGCASTATEENFQQVCATQITSCQQDR
ncbi:MAG: hypothetical protein HYV07_19845 [Deltaproteobacteria bacterium]|nr:hypothetical protein [Deltaproteobacteria bacterium]